MVCSATGSGKLLHLVALKGSSPLRCTARIVTALVTGTAACTALQAHFAGLMWYH